MAEINFFFSLLLHRDQRLRDEPPSVGDNDPLLLHLLIRPLLPLLLRHHGAAGVGLLVEVLRPDPDPGPVPVLQLEPVPHPGGVGGGAGAAPEEAVGAQAEALPQVLLDGLENIREKVSLPDKWLKIVSENTNPVIQPITIDLRWDDRSHWTDDAVRLVRLIAIQSQSHRAH